MWPICLAGPEQRAQKAQASDQERNTDESIITVHLREESIRYNEKVPSYLETFLPRSKGKVHKIPWA